LPKYDLGHVDVSEIPSIAFLQSLSKSMVVIKQHSIAILTEKYKAHASAVEGSVKPGIFQVADARI
jgi:hypothetical protein